MTSSLKDRHLYGAGAAVCAVCCAVPLFTLLGIGIAGTAATVAAFAFAGIVFGLVVAPGSLMAVWSQRRERRPGICGVAQSGPVDLELSAAQKEPEA